MRIIQRLKENQEKLSQSGPVNIVFLGDSVTNGCFEPGVFDFEKVYHAQLGGMLRARYPHATLNIINAGIGGTTARFALGRMERDVLCYHPDAAVVCFGLNDVNGSVENYTGALKSIFTALREKDIEAVFLTPNMLNTRVDEATLPQLRDYARKTMEMQNSGKMDAYIDAARACAREEGAAVCDCYALWKKMAERGEDTTALLVNLINHPNREMHTLFAKELLRVFESP